jgi:surface protein
MAINVGDNFSYQGKKYLDSRQSFETLQELQSYTEVPEGFIAYCEENKKRYEFIDGVWTEYIVSAEIEDDPNIATKTYVDELIESHTHEEYLTKHQDISHLATKAELHNKLDDVEINEEETTDSQTALDFFANGNKVKTVYVAKGGGSGSASAYISTTLPEEAMIETGFDFDILIDFYSPNPGKGTLKVFVNDVDVLSTAIKQGETTTTLTHDKLTKGTNRIVVYVLDRIGTMSNSLTFYVRYGSTELTGEFDSSMAYDYGANIRYYFIATALDTSLALTFYMSIDNVVQNGVSCVSDVRGYFTFPNSLEAGGHYCECWVEDSNGSKSNIEQFNLVILDNNTLAIVTETRSASVEEGSQLVLDYRVYKKNETSFIIKTYVDEELVNTGTCGLTKSFYKSSTLREGMHNIKIEAWDITETVSDYVTWTVIITPSTYTMIEPATAGSIFMATAKNRTNGDANREIWTGYNQDGEPIDAALFNFAFNSESGWMDDQLFITGNSHVEIPIQPLANNARYGFTLDIEFLTKPIGVEDAEVLRLWNDTDNCGIKITTEQLILQSKTGNKCELYFTEDQIVSAIFIIDRHEKTAKVYLNGVMCAAFALSDYTAEGVSYLEDFTVNDNLYLGGKNKNGYSTIKNLRIYELALSSSEILNNFISNETDKAKQQALVNFQKGEDLPTVTVYCDFSGLGKDDKKYCDIVYNSPDPVKYGESFSLMGKYSQLQYQGTSSMQYPIKNYRLNPKDANGKVKIKLPFSQPETRFTLKADFMSSGHWQNTGLTKWINDNLYNYKEDDPKSMNPAKWWAIQNGKDPNDYRECIYGFPCRLILVNDGNSPLNEGQQEPTPGNTKDMGIFNFNLDKDCENSLGFKIKDFPNALSMEVTANSDTSAGAFMSFKQHYTLEFIDTGSLLESRPANFLEEGTHIIGGTLPTIYTYRGGTQVSSNSYGQSNTFNTDSTIDNLLIRFTDKTVSSFSIDGVIYDIEIVEKSDSSECVLLPPSGDELAYIKESFELRYPDEDDVPEGWGFMSIDGVDGGGLKTLIDWVDNSTDEEFISEFEEHFHKDYTLRYFLLVMVLGMVDNLGKNMMLDSYDGKIWMPRFYDCDTICSYDNSGAIKFDVDIEMAQGYWNTSSSRLWTRVRDLFHDELVAKYNDMRQNGMSYESFMNVFYDEQIAKIPQKYYNMDADVKYLPYADEYLGKAHGDGYEHLKRWLKNRLIFTDSLYDYAPSYTNDMITFRANTTEEMSITIETYTPVYQHVSWYNGNMQKEKIAKGTQLTFKGFAQAATDQEVLVYGGSNIKRIIGISTMNPNSMLIGNASRLVELDISDCPILTDVNSNKANFTPHTYLNKLDISNCPLLGGSLRLNYSPLIQEVNAINTSVTDLQLPSSIRNLHTLKVPGALKSLTLSDAPILSTLEFDGPNQLEMVSMINCNALTNVINFDMTQIPTVTLNNSYDTDELYMSKTTNLSLVNMSRIKKLTFIPNNEHESFNLTELRNSPNYMISAINCPNLKTFMTTAEYRNSYKNGEYGDVKPNIVFCANTLDISNTKITDVNFLCTTDIYQLKLPDTVNNFICDSTYDLDTYYLSDGDFDKVHHELIDAYTMDYNYNVTKVIMETYGYNAEYSIPQFTETVDPYNDNYSEPIDITGVYGIKAYIQTNDNITRFFGYTIYDSNMTILLNNAYTTIDLGYKDVPTTAKWLRFRTRFFYNNVDGFIKEFKPMYVLYKKATPNLIPSSADGSLIFSMYAPTVNTAVPAEGIWDLYGLTFEEFYTYGMNNDIVVSGDTISMPHRYADYNVTIQNANIMPTNHPTMLYPLLVNENKPILGTIDYTNYQGDDLSYAMAYTNTSEVDIVIPNSVIMNSQYIHNIDKESEYVYVDPRTIIKYKCTSNATPVTLPNDYSAYSMAETDNGDGTYTVTIIADDLNNLPNKVQFKPIGSALLEVYFVNINNITNMSYMFQDCVNLTSVYTSNWDTSKVIDMGFMFSNCKKLTSLDVSNWDTSSVIAMRSMFLSCSALTSLDVSNWVTSKVTAMNSMFQSCSALTSLDVSNWVTSKVTDMSNMFNNCKNLTSLDASNWNTSEVTNMSNMFSSSGLTSLDVSNWVTSKVTTMSNMFSGCSSLTEIIGIDEWYCPALYSVGSMFQNCNSITKIDASSWKRGEDGEAAISAGAVYSFANTTSLLYLDISGWTFNSTTPNFANTFSKSITTLKWSNWACTTNISQLSNLTAESVSGLLANLATVTNGQTLTLGSTLIAKVSDAEIASATNKGWTIA